MSHQTVFQLTLPFDLFRQNLLFSHHGALREWYEKAKIEEKKRDMDELSKAKKAAEDKVSFGLVRTELGSL